MSARLRDALIDMISIFETQGVEIAVFGLQSDKNGMRSIFESLSVSEDKIGLASETGQAEVNPRPSSLSRIHTDRDR
jgi:hypothetical protein